MKTSKFMYRVDEYDTDSVILDGLKILNTFYCVTLAEARLVASRCVAALISCVGEIEYYHGIEIEKK